MRLLIQPGSGIQPLLSAIEHAKERIEIVIFRFDRAEVENALARAAARGVFVHTLIAHVTGTGEEQLRKLELRFLAAGINVARTSDDLRRYHYKFMIIDRRTLFLLAFNFTSIDIVKSRSFGVVTTDQKTVQEAIKLFEADVTRQVYEPARSGLVVSPVNAREQLTKFLESAKKQLLIYDLRISDGSLLRILGERLKAGVELKVIGGISVNRSGLDVRAMAGPRLHTRAIIKDGRHAFIGSQSLRATELDARREAGIIFRDALIVKRLRETFEEDWQRAGESPRHEIPTAGKLAKRVAGAIAEELPPVAPMVAKAVEDVTGSKNGISVDHEEIEQTVKQAVKDAVKSVLKEAVAEAADAGKP